MCRMTGLAGDANLVYGTAVRMEDLYNRRGLPVR